MRTLLIDDERAARSRLRRMLVGHGRIAIVGEAQDGLEAVQLIESEKPELLFLDVQMPGLDGFEVLREVASRGALPLVIFVTGFDEHALRAFQAHALAYLMKPIEQEALDLMVERAWRIHSHSDRQSEQDGVRDVLAVAPATLDRIVARKANRMLLLDPADICFFSMEAGMVRAHTAADSWWVNHTMTDLETALTRRRFFRAHRSMLVNLERVGEVVADARSTFQLIMKDERKTVIDVSERQARALRGVIRGL